MPFRSHLRRSPRRPATLGVRSRAHRLVDGQVPLPVPLEGHARDLVLLHATLHAGAVRDAAELARLLVELEGDLPQGKEGRNEERKGMEEGKGVMGALFRADHGRPGKALPRSHA